MEKNKVRIVRINEEGQITIPSAFRKELKLQPDMKLCIYIEDGKIIIEPLSDDPIQALCELLKGDSSIS